MNLGTKLLKLRKEKGLSQEEVADRLNVSRQTISKWETDQSTPDFDKILPLCELYEITADDLLNNKSIVKTEISNVENTNFKDNSRKRAIMLIISILLYFVAVVEVVIAIPVLKVDPIVASSIFLLICGVATCPIIYSAIVYKKNKDIETKRKSRLLKRVEEIVSLLTLVFYLWINYVSHAWHITWLIWIVYVIVLKIIELIFSLRGMENE